MRQRLPDRLVAHNLNWGQNEKASAISTYSAGEQYCLPYYISASG